MRGNELLYSMKNSAQMKNYRINQHGDVTRLSDGNTPVNDYKYDSFGNVYEQSGSEYNPFTYCGEYFDTETNFVYLRNRYYEPSTGRFTQPDMHWNQHNMIYGDNGTSIPDSKSIMQSNNLYAYCIGDPINLNDPLGLDVYYYVNEQFKGEGKKDKKILEKLYGEPTHVIITDTRDSFIDEWNKMGNWNGENVDVSLVVINMHGSPITLSPHSDGGTGRIYTSDITDGTLIPKNVGDIMVLGCNSGHFDHRYSSLVNKMLVYNNVNSVIASDGTVRSRSLFGNYKSISDDNFITYLWSKKKYRKNIGFIKYTKK